MDQEKEKLGTRQLLIKYKKMIALSLIVVICGSVLCYLLGDAIESSTIFSKRGLVTYVQTLVAKYPHRARFYMLYLPYVFLNLIKLVIFAGFVLVVNSFLKATKDEQLDLTNSFKVNWSLGDILTVYILSFVIHTASIFVWDEMFADNIRLWIVIEATVQSILICFFVIATVVVTKESSVTRLGIDKFSIVDFLSFTLKTVLSMLLVAAMISFVLDYKIMPAGGWTELFSGNTNIGKGSFFGLEFILLVLISPLSEEMFFRGFLYAYFRNKWGVRKAAVLISILFSILHLNLIAFAFLFVLSMFLCLLYERKKNLFYPMVVHALYNLFLTTGLIVDAIK